MFKSNRTLLAETDINTCLVLIHELNESDLKNLLHYVTKLSLIFKVQ